MITARTIELSNLVKLALANNGPILSGNLRAQSNMIKTVMQPHNVYLTLSAPLYDVNKWEKTGLIQPIAPYKKYPNIKDYAMWLNEYGAFGTHNKSEHWTNRTIYYACLIYAKKIGAVVINELEL